MVTLTGECVSMSPAPVCEEYLLDEIFIKLRKIFANY